MSKSSKSRSQRRRERERSRQVESRVVESSEPVAEPEQTAGEPARSEAEVEVAPTAITPARGEPASDEEAGVVAKLFGGGGRSVDEGTGLAHFERPPGVLRPFARRAYQREQALNAIRGGFDNLSGLMGDIRDGLGASVEKQSELLEQLKYLPVVAEQNAKSAERFEAQYREQNRLQAEAVKALREQVTGQRDQHEQLGKLLGGMGKESRDQKRDVDELQTRLERMRQSDQHIADGLTNVGQTLRRVGEQGNAQGELALRMQQAFDERTRQIEESMRRQSSRQTLLLTVVLLLAVAALAAVATVGFLYLRQAGAL